MAVTKQDLEEAAQPGLCFQFAIRFGRRLFNARQDDDAQIVHGTIKNPVTLHRFPHAWVEWDGQVFDNGFPEGVPQKMFYTLLKPRNKKKYSIDQAMLNLLRDGHYGPWET